MITKEKLAIIATVPIVMIINLSILNLYFGDKKNIRLPQESNNTANINNNNSTISEKNSSPVYFSKTKTKLKISHFPQPPKHTFAGNEASELAEEEENIKTKGVVIK